MNPLLEAAQNIGEPPSDNDDKKATTKAPVVADNGNGSYERFMMTFGSPKRWAGR